MPQRYTFTELRKFLTKKRLRKPFIKRAVPLYRLIRRQNFVIFRYLLAMTFRLWLRNIKNSEFLPKEGPSIIVSNHLSYYDWLVFSSIFHKQYLVFIANENLLNRPLIGWLMKMNILIFIDPKNPGFKFYREAIKRLREGYILVVYPEGMRSRTGRMLEPKTGFIKIAVKAGVAVTPVAMSGTYKILPPHKKIPALRRCDIIIGEPIKINRKNKLFKHIFERRGLEEKLTESDEKEIAYIIMNQIRMMAGQEWADNIPKNIGILDV